MDDTDAAKIRVTSYDPCPGCGGYGMIVKQGDELHLKQLEVI